MDRRATAITPAETAALIRLYDSYTRRGWERADFIAIQRVAHRMSFGRGQLAGRTTGLAAGVFVHIVGAARMYVLSSDGKQMALARLRRAGDIFALGSAEEEPPEDEYVEVLADDTVIYSVSWPDLLRVAGQHGRVALALAEAEQRMRIDRERALAERYLYPIKARLAHALYRMSSRDPDALVRETREAIADDIGTSEDRVTKALHQLRAEGLVSFEDFQRSSLELVNRDRLRTYGRK